MKCLIVQPIHAAGVALLTGAAVEPVMCPDTNLATVTRLIRDCQAVITRDVGLSADAIDSADALKIIVSHGAGHDSIDKVAAASAHRIDHTARGNIVTRRAHVTGWTSACLAVQ